MYAYSGKFQWKDYGKDETFVLVLPQGPVRVGDSVYLFFQFTVDARGVKKANRFEPVLVHKVSKTPKGDDIFTLSHCYYTWTVTTQQVYDKLSVTMSNPSQHEHTFDLKRTWKSKDELSNGIARIWTGKINWLKHAVNEMAIFIAPEGLGDGKPILSLWQWTEDFEGKKKATLFQNEVQKLESDTSDSVKFSYSSKFNLAFTWDKRTEKLAVHVKGPDADRDLGEFTRSAVIDRRSHLIPLESPPTKAELEVRLPQAQPSLPRILTALPFPQDLVDTLAHTAAFVDQAGYLAKYATDKRFNALDAELHTRNDELEAVKSKNNGLSERLKELEDQLSVEKAKTVQLSNDLSKARDKESELNLKIDKLKTKAAEDREHDAEDEIALDKLRREKADLQKELDEASAALAEKTALLVKKSAAVLALGIKLAQIEAEYTIEKKHCNNLHKENREHKAKITQLEADLARTQKDLGVAREELKAAQKKNTDDKEKITKLETELSDKETKLQGASEALKKAQDEKDADERWHQKDDAWHEDDDRDHDEERKALQDRINAIDARRRRN